MPYSRGSRYPRISASSRRKTVWDGGPLEVDGSVTSSVARLWSTAVVLATAENITIVRIRGIIHLVVQTASANGAGFRGAIGIGIFPTAAVTAGVASLNIPNSDPDWGGWMWHQFFDVRSITATIADGVNAGVLHQRIEIDSKAMRKMGPQQSLVGITEVVESDTASMEIQAQTRVLVKLS